MHTSFDIHVLPMLDANVFFQGKSILEERKQKVVKKNGCVGLYAMIFKGNSAFRSLQRGRLYDGKPVKYFLGEIKITGK